MTTRPIFSLRSIPVHTGEPKKVVDIAAIRRVYPRTHGGTNMTMIILGHTEGLSPYTRGNLEGRMLEMDTYRSIPVHTGEPVGPGLVGVAVGVYPRTHGGTFLVFYFGD